MPGPKNEKCEDCYYAFDFGCNPEDYPNNKKQFRCVVSHPANWRTVHEDEWCGEFKPKCDDSPQQS